MSSVKLSHNSTDDVREVKLHLMSGLSLGSVLEENRRNKGITTTRPIPAIQASNTLGTSPRRAVIPLLSDDVSSSPPPPGAAVINWMANRGHGNPLPPPSPRTHSSNNNNALISTMMASSTGSNQMSGKESHEQRSARKQLVKHSRKKLPLPVSQSQLVQHAGTIGGGMEEVLANTISGVCLSSYLSDNTGSRSPAYSATASALAIAPLNMSKLLMNDSSFSGLGTTGSRVNNDHNNSILRSTMSGRRRSVSSSTSEDSETAFPLYGGPAQHSRPIATGKTLKKLVEPTDVRARVKHTSSSRVCEPAVPPHQLNKIPPIFPSISQSFSAHQLVHADISAKYGKNARGGTKSGSSCRAKPERLRLRNFVESKQKASCLHADGPFSNGTIQSPRITVPSTGRTFPQQHATLMLAHALKVHLLPNEAIARLTLLEEEHTAFEYLIADHLITFRALEWGRQQRYLAFHAMNAASDAATKSPTQDSTISGPTTTVLSTSERPPMTEEERSRLVASVLNEYRVYEEQLHLSAVPNSRGANGRDCTASGEVVRGYSTQIMQPRSIRVLNDEQGDSIGDRTEEAARRFIVASVKRKIHEEQRAKEAGAVSGGGRGQGGWRVTSGGQRHHALRAGEPLPLSATIYCRGDGESKPSHPLHSQNQKDVDDLVDRVALELERFALLGSTLIGSTELHNPTVSAQGGAISDEQKFVTTSLTARPMSPKCFVTPRPPAVEAIHTRNQHVGRQIRTERHERNQQLAANALLAHEPHYSQQSQPKTTIAALTASVNPSVKSGLESETTALNSDETANTNPPELTPSSSESRPEPRLATYITPSPLSPRTTIQTSKSVVLKDDVIGGFLTSTPLVGMSKSMGPLVSPAAPFPRKHITSTHHRPKANTAHADSSNVKLTHMPVVTRCISGGTKSDTYNEVTLSIPLPPPTIQQREASSARHIPTRAPAGATSLSPVSPSPVRLTVVTSTTTSPGSTSLSHSGQHGLNSSAIDDEQDISWSMEGT